MDETAIWALGSLGLNPALSGDISRYRLFLIPFPVALGLDDRKFLVR